MRVIAALMENYLFIYQKNLDQLLKNKFMRDALWGSYLTQYLVLSSKSNTIMTKYTKTDSWGILYEGHSCLNGQWFLHKSKYSWQTSQKIHERCPMRAISASIARNFFTNQTKFWQTSQKNVFMRDSLWGTYMPL